MREYAYISCLRRNSRRKTQAADSNIEAAFLFVGRYTHHTGLCPTGSAPTPITQTSSGASPGQRMSRLIALGISAVSCRSLTGIQIPASPSRVGVRRGY